MRVRGAENVSPLFTNNSNIKSDKKASLCNWLLVYCTQCSEIYNLQPRVLCKLQQRIRSEWNRHLEIRGKPREIRADTQYERLWEKGNLCQRERNKVIERNFRWNSFSSAKYRMWTSTFKFFFFFLPVSFFNIMENLVMEFLLGRSHFIHYTVIQCSRYLKSSTYILTTYVR